MKQTERVEKLVKWVKENGYEGTQTFDCKSSIGDSMVTVYEEDGITVDYCAGWEYFEIFGLSEEEYESLSGILYIRWMKPSEITIGDLIDKLKGLADMYGRYTPVYVCNRLLSRHIDTFYAAPDPYCEEATGEEMSKLGVPSRYIMLFDSTPR